MFMLPKIHIFPFKKMRRIIIQFLFSLVNSSAVKHNFSDMKKNQKKNLQSKDAASDLATFIEAFFGIGILLLAFQKLDIFMLASQSDVLRRRR